MYKIIFYKDSKDKSEVQKYILSLKKRTDKIPRLNSAK